VDAAGRRLEDRRLRGTDRTNLLGCHLQQPKQPGVVRPKPFKPAVAPPQFVVTEGVAGIRRHVSLDRPPEAGLVIAQGPFRHLSGRSSDLDRDAAQC
jgi:hypothetical protein